MSCKCNNYENPISNFARTVLIASTSSILAGLVVYYITKPTVQQPVVVRPNGPPDSRFDPGTAHLPGNLTGIFSFADNRR